MKLIDLTGRRFGRLIIVEREGWTKEGRILWRCVCDCGQSLLVVAQSLKTGGTKSCGCLRSEVSAATGRSCRGRPRRKRAPYKRGEQHPSKNQAIADRLTGEKYSSIALRYGVHEATVWRWCNP